MLFERLAKAKEICLIRGGAAGEARFRELLFAVQEFMYHLPRGGQPFADSSSRFHAVCGGTLGEHSFVLQGFKTVVLATLRVISRILSTPLSLALLNAYIYESSRANRFMHSLYERRIMQLFPSTEYTYLFQMVRTPTRVHNS